MEAGSLTPRGDRSVLERSPRERAADPVFRAAAPRRSGSAGPRDHRLLLHLPRGGGERRSSQVRRLLGFIFSATTGTCRKDIFGAWPLLVGTLISVGHRADHRRADRRRHRPVPHRAVPAAPARARWRILVDLLAAVPSVVYGLWGFFVLVPHAEPVPAVVRGHVLVPALRRRHGGGPQLLHRRPDPGDHDPADRLARSRARSSRRVPVEHKEAALALGATRWEMIRMAVLPYSRAGHHRRLDARPRPRASARPSR